jgi:hypothetical protein
VIVGLGVAVTAGALGGGDVDPVEDGMAGATLTDGAHAPSASAPTIRTWARLPIMLV